MDWMTRNQCGPWPFWLVAVYISANLGIFAAYVMLPVGLASGRKKSGFVIGTPEQTVLWAMFILSCGLGHIIENVGAFLVPNYYFFTAWHLSTAALSLYTAYTFPRAIKGVMEELSSLREQCRLR